MLACLTNCKHEPLKLRPTYEIPELPLRKAVETENVLRALSPAHRHLAELKGRASSIPNPGILIDTLFLQEAKASSEIENIVTTHDELFQTTLFPESPASPAAKEVAQYRDALRLGFERVCKQDGLLTNNTIVAMFQVLKRTTSSFRETPGTALKNESSGKLVYIPPQDGGDIKYQMECLEKYINEDDLCGLDPLIKMAVIHHQFESIHPFSDGNGRIGRIINVLYLTRQELLDTPILYLSRFITSNKGEYYQRLQEVRDTGEWEPWLLYMLQAVAETSVETLDLVEGIRALMAAYKKRIRSDHTKIYSQDLLNTLFRYPYTRIELVQRELGKTRQTAAKYLDELCEAQLLSKHKFGKSNYYINDPLAALFLDAPRAEEPEDVRESGVSAEVTAEAQRLRNSG